MPKADFTFYELSPDLPEFVIPRPANDRYNGSFTPRLDLLPNDTVDTLWAAFPGSRVTLTTTPGELDVVHQFEQRQAARQLGAGTIDFLAQEATVAQVRVEDFSFDDHDLYHMFSALEKALTTNMRRPAVKYGGEPEPDAPDLTVPLASASHDYPFLTNAKGQPTNPWLAFLVSHSQRVYVWSAGPERTSKKSHR